MGQQAQKEEVNTVEKAVLTVMANCIVRKGTKCFINFPFHSDWESLAFCMNAHGQNAEVLSINGDTGEVEVRILTGPWTGKTKKVSPSVLYLEGTFQMRE